MKILSYHLALILGYFCFQNYIYLFDLYTKILSTTLKKRFRYRYRLCTCKFQVVKEQLHHTPNIRL